LPQWRIGYKFKNVTDYLCFLNANSGQQADELISYTWTEIPGGIAEVVLPAIPGAAV